MRHQKNLRNIHFVGIKIGIEAWLLMAAMGYGSVTSFSTRELIDFNKLSSFKCFHHGTAKEVPDGYSDRRGADMTWTDLRPEASGKALIC